VLEAGSPLRVFRTSPSGLALLERLERGEDPLPGDLVLVQRLVDAGAIHPLVEPRHDRLSATTVVIPARVTNARDAERLVRLVQAVAPMLTIVVSDASPYPMPHLPCRTIVHDTRGGPGAARNTGLAEATTDHVAFLDLDVFVSCDDLAALLGHLDDSRTALVAPRVRSANGTGVLARYERVRSPLDRGPDEGLVRPGSRVPWVPSAVLVCRTAALRAVGGFDRSLWAGEDVDLAWRLGDAGWRCRYAPEIKCDHEPRGDLTAFIAQRFRDGRSTSPLSRRHSVRLAPVSMSWFEAGWWLIAATWTPLVLLAGLATTTVRLARRLDERGVPRQSCRLAVASLARSARHLARAVARPWLPLLLVLALGSRRARRIVAAAVLIPPLIDWWRTTPSLDPVRFTAISVIDDVSHATGIAAGATIDRNARPVLPHLRARPTSRRVTPTSPTTVPDAHRYGEQT